MLYRKRSVETLSRAQKTYHVNMQIILTINSHLVSMRLVSSSELTFFLRFNYIQAATEVGFHFFFVQKKHQTDKYMSTFYM